MPNMPIPAGMNPLEYGNMLLGGTNKSVNDPFVLKKNLEAQQQQQADGEAQAQAVLDEVQKTIQETSASNKLKELALKLKDELNKSRELEEKLQADPEAAELFQKMSEQKASAGESMEEAPK